MSRGGYEKASQEGGSFRDALKNKDEAITLEQEGRLVKDAETALRLIGEYERRRESEPDNVKLVRNLAELHATARDYYRSLEHYNHLESMSGGIDAGIERDRAEVTVKRFNQVIEQELDPNAEDYEEQKADLERQRDEFILEDCRRRVEQYPTDMHVRFEFGKMLFQTGDYGEAVKQLQRAQTNQHVKIAAKLLLARCFSQRNMNDLAARQLREAIDEKPVMDAEKKDLLYTLGNVLEAMNQVAEAV